MAQFSLSNTINANKVFLVKRSELEGRIEPEFYSYENKMLLERLRSKKHYKLKEIVRFSSEAWNQKDYFTGTFPYIEISEIDLDTGKVEEIKEVPIEEAPSRAKMIIRNGDIIISTTRPTRGAISYFNEIDDIKIASTGFSVIRKVNEEVISKETLFNILRLPFCLQQMGQRSSGGNYPAITQEELGNIIIPFISKENQQQIINLYQKAYSQKQQKEAEAKALLESIDCYLLQELGITLPEKDNSLQNRIFTTQFSELTGGRFDAISNKSKELEDALLRGSFPIIKLSKLVKNIKTGTTPHNSLNPYTEKGIPFLRNTNLQKGELKLHEIKYIKNELAKQLTYSYYGEIIVCIAGTVGYSALNTSKEPLAINQNITALKIKTDTVNIEYLNYFFNTNLNIELVKRLCSIATISYLNNSNLLSLNIPLPPFEKQNEIATYIQKIRAKAKQLQEEAKNVLDEAKKEVEKMILGSD